MELLRPFANTGDKEDFDENTAPDGSMSLEKGFTTLFELKPEEGGLFILRRKFNQLMYLMSKANVEFNTQSFPSWISDADGLGTPYSYNTYAIVRYTDGNNYISTIDNNTGEPTVDTPDWQEFSLWIQSLAPTSQSITGTATFTNSTNNLNLTGLGDLSELEIGDVYSITGAANSENNELFTVEEIIDSNNVIFNKAHAGKSRTVAPIGMKVFIDEVSTANVTITLVSKWYNAPLGLGQGEVDVTADRSIAVPYTNDTNRSFEISMHTNKVGINPSLVFSINNLTVEDLRIGTSAFNSTVNFTKLVRKDVAYELVNATNLLRIVEVR